VQCNLYGLPADLVVKILVAFVEETQRAPGTIANYEDWLVAAYGRPLAETFPMQYTKKYHTTDAANLTTDWMGPRMYRPTLEEVFFGAVSPTTPNIHYVTHFRYPTHGGFAAYLERFSKNGDIVLEHRLVGLDPKAKELTFANGTRARYDAVVSSVPLPELVPMIAGAPADVREAAQKLACSTAVIVNVGVNRAELSQAHISYFYDSDVFFTRLNFPHMLSPNNVPAGAGAVQAEVYFSKKYKPLDRSPDDCIEPVIRDLYRVGVLREGDEILHRNAELIDYANIIFDLDRKQALGVVHGYLDDIGVQHCGRYGDWGYLWTDDSFKSGELAADRALSGLSR
jgi:protoporphyrinogen oxidase